MLEIFANKSMKLKMAQFRDSIICGEITKITMNSARQPLKEKMKSHSIVVPELQEHEVQSIQRPTLKKHVQSQ